jgi:hypothetical protein
MYAYLIRLYHPSVSIQRLPFNEKEITIKFSDMCECHNFIRR